MKRINLLAGTLFLLCLYFTSCSTKQANKPEQLPSDSLKTAVANSLDGYALTLAGSVIDTGQAFSVLQAFLEANTAVYGSALAWAPVITGTDTFRFSPYMYRNGKGYASLYLEESYDYSQDDWYTKPVSLKKGFWSDPYYDTGGGNVWMITYSVPLYNPDSSLLGVITADLEIKK